MMKNFFTNTLLVMVACLLGMACMEIVLRVFVPRVLIKPLGIVLDPDLIYRLPPNAHGRYGKQDGEWYMDVRTNSHGLRDREISFEKKPGVFRILGLGDSMTYAEGAEPNEIYYKKLEASLARKMSVEVINAAVRGWGPDQEIAFFAKEGYQYKPDATLIAFYSGNDFEDALHGNIYRIENGVAVHQPASIETSAKYRYYSHQNRIQSLPLYSWFMANSHLANLLRQAYPRMAIRRVYRRKTDSEVNFNSINEKEEERAWCLVQSIYEHLFREKDRTGKIFAILIPTYNEVLSGVSPRIKRMISLCQKWDIPYLNLLPGLNVEKGRINQLFFPRDRHFTPEGHLWIADKLEKALFSAGVLPDISTSK